MTTKIAADSDGHLIMTVGRGAEIAHTVTRNLQALTDLINGEVERIRPVLRTRPELLWGDLKDARRAVDYDDGESVPDIAGAKRIARLVQRDAELRPWLGPQPEDDPQQHYLEQAAFLAGEDMNATLADKGIGTQRKDRALIGAQFILDSPPTVEAVWGGGTDVLWASGEPLMIVGPEGVGKTTLMQQLVLIRLGLHKGPLLGFPVEVEPRRCLYLALDRPRQIARSFRRMVRECDRDALELLTVWPGPLEFDVVKEPQRLAQFVHGFDAGTVVIDSLKDLAMELSRDEVGSRVNQAVQHCIADGIEVAESHHQRKAQADNKKPRKLADVYGSRWLTAGCGSVVLVWGEPGDVIVELNHLKQPAAEVGPLTLMHDHDRGRTQLHEQPDLYALVSQSLNGGLTVRDAACALYGCSSPDRNQIEKTRRKLEQFVTGGHAIKVAGKTHEPTKYRPVEKRVA